MSCADIKRSYHCSEEFDPDVLIFWTTWVLQRMYVLVSAFVTQHDSLLLKANISFDITPEEFKLKPGTKLQELFAPGVNSYVAR